MIVQFRLALLRLTCLSIFLTVSKLIIDPAAGQRAFATFSFPKTVPITGWQFVQSQSLSDRRSESLRYNWVVSGQHYRYQKTNAQQQQLNIEVRYVVNTNGNISQLIQEQQTIASNASQTQVETDLGAYSRFTIDHQTHLTSCINPRGGSTATSEQFLHDRYSDAWQLDRLLSWSLGQNDLLDKRCLWVDLSLSADAQPSDQVAADLEKLWRDRGMIWRSQFPQP
jgi:cyanosortase A-associated protein